jgi:hypothetical protein
MPNPKFNAAKKIINFFMESPFLDLLRAEEERGPTGLSGLSRRRRDFWPVTGGPKIRTRGGKITFGMSSAVPSGLID